MLSIKRIASIVLPVALKLHSYSYSMSSFVGTVIESEGIHPKHRLMKYHDWFAGKLKKEWDILDIGCGNGALTYDLKSACNSVTGIDIEEKNIKYARAKYSVANIFYICADATQYDYNNKFDAIILSNVLEHIEHRIDFLKKIFKSQNKKMSPVLLLRVPMINRDWITLYKKEMGLEWRLDTTHFKEYTKEEIFEELCQSGLKVEEYEIQFGEFYCVAVLDETKQDIAEFCNKRISI